jgi:hypothetical protein
MSLAVVRLRFRRMVGGRIVALTAPPASIHVFEWSAWTKKERISYHTFPEIIREMVPWLTLNCTAKSCCLIRRER